MKYIDFAVKKFSVSFIILATSVEKQHFPLILVDSDLIKEMNSILLKSMSSLWNVVLARYTRNFL